MDQNFNCLGDLKQNITYLIGMERSDDDTLRERLF